MSKFRRMLMMANAVAPIPPEPPTPVLPYDAEVEYLESSGTQWIDLGIAAKWTTDAYIKMGFYFLDNTANQRAFGAMTSTNANYGFQIYYNTSGNTCGVHTFNNRAPSFSGDTMFSYHDWEITNSTIYIDGVSSSNKATARALNINGYLFGRNYNGANNLSKVRIYYFKYYNGSDLVDLVPVRVGQVGYMYDKESKQLLGNSGTGSFILGNDKN